jgi:hypothetical protein
MARAHSLKGSGDFDGGSAKWIVLVLEAGSQSEAYDAAAAEAPTSYLGVARGPASVEAQGGRLYVVTFTYTVRTEGTAVTPPPEGTGGPGSGNPSPPSRGGEPDGPVVHPGRRDQADLHVAENEVQNGAQRRRRAEFQQTHRLQPEGPERRRV